MSSALRAMSAWTKRRDPRGGVTFIAYSAADIELLVPPGGRLAVEPPASEWEGDGLWLHAVWSRADEPLIELDLPRSLRRVPTIAVVWMVGEDAREEVAAVMSRQLEQAWRLSEARGRRPLEDRRAHQHAALLMELTREVGDAFPAETFWRQTWTVNYDDLIDRLCEPPRSRPADEDRVLSTWVVAYALVRAVWGRVSGRRRVTAGQLMGWVGRPQGDADAGPAACMADERPLLVPPS